jgi:FecR protein
MARLIWAVALAVAIVAAHSSASTAEPKICSATGAKNRVEGTSQPISIGTDVYSNEVVRTAPNSVADIKFIDETDLSVGPISEIVLDKFIYDPTGSNGTVVIQATRGAFRFVTGKQDKKAYQIKTPFGTIGMRGTVLELVLVPCRPGMKPENCGLKAKLVEGGADIQTPNGNIELNDPNTMVTINGNGVASPSVSAPNSILSLASAGEITTGSLGSGPGGGAVRAIHLPVGDPIPGRQATSLVRQLITCNRLPFYRREVDLQGPRVRAIRLARSSRVGPN